MLRFGQDGRTWFRIDFDAGDQAVHAHVSWLGCEGVHSCVRNGSLAQLAQLCFMWPVDSWEDKAAEVLEKRWNLKYFKMEPWEPGFVGIPDGPFRTLILPLSAEALPALVEAFAGFRSDPAIDFPVSGFVVPLAGSVSYVEGKNPGWSNTPENLFLRTFLATGLVPAGIPIRERTSDGDAVWTILRRACVAFIGVPFAGMIALLENLHRAGLLAAGPMHSDAHGPLTDSVEFSGCIVPDGRLLTPDTIEWWSEDRKRRISWMLPEDYLELFRGHLIHRNDHPDKAKRFARAIAEHLDTRLHLALQKLRGTGSYR